MPKIIINEIDNTLPGRAEYKSFAVLVPGVVATGKGTAGFDENGVCELITVEDFDNKVGAVKLISTNNEKGHIGNQIAYKLLELGYKVLFKKIAKEDESSLDLDNLELNFDGLEDKTIYDFRYVLTGWLSPSETNTKSIMSLAKLRGDCIALVDVPKSSYVTSTTDSDDVTTTTVSTQAKFIELFKSTVAAGTGSNTDEGTNSGEDDASNSSGTSTANTKAAAGTETTPTISEIINSHTAIFAPTVIYSEATASSSLFSNSEFPASFHYLACAMTAQRKGFAEWYAVAGYTRGICPDFRVVSTSIRLGETAVEALSPRSNGGGGAINNAINLIVKIKDNYYIWGNRTGKTLGEELVALDFLNIRQLCCTIKKTIYEACKRFTYDPNSEVLWINFKGAITPVLDRMKADQGIYDYRITKVHTDLKGTLKALIRIVPIEAVEDFTIGLSLEDSLDGIAKINFE